MRRNAKKELLCELHLRVSPTLTATTSLEHNPDTFLQHSCVVKESHYVLSGKRFRNNCTMRKSMKRFRIPAIFVQLLLWVQVTTIMERDCMKKYERILFANTSIINLLGCRWSYLICFYRSAAMVKLVALAFTVYFATVCFVLLIGIAKQVQSAKFDCLDFKPRSMCDVYEGKNWLKVLYNFANAISLLMVKLNFCKVNLVVFKV